MMELGWIYLLVINAITFVVYGLDKWKARHNRWRVSEATLLWLAAFGGAMGALGGMKMFRHKTQHLNFKFFVPFLLILWLAGMGYALYVVRGDLW